MPMYRAFAAFFKGDTGDTRLTHWLGGERNFSCCAVEQQYDRNAVTSK